MKSQDLIFKSVINMEGKEIGFVKDVAIDFHNRKIIGLITVSSSILKKNIFIAIENIVSFNKVILIDGYDNKSSLKISDIKGLQIFDCDGKVLGIINDVIFETNTFCINYIVLSKGFLLNIFSGKVIINVNDVIEGDYNFIIKNNSKIQFSSLPSFKHKEGTYL
ncbi:PRC-barrel domain-containing protein [Clostridium sp. DL1XJH146]